jgi:hypothetical protein
MRSRFFAFGALAASATVATGVGAYVSAWSRSRHVRTPTKKLIILSGPIGAGKSTAGRLLCQEYPSIQTLSFAAPLKQFLSALGYSDQSLYGTQAQKLELHPFWGVSARDAMQRLGTNILRRECPKHLPEFDPIWVRALEFKVQTLLEQGTAVVVDDGRFPDEIAMLKKYGGVHIRIVRQGTTHAPGSHASETALDNVVPDHVIVNDGSIDDLRRKLLQIVA